MIASLSKLLSHIVEGFCTVIQGGVAVRDPPTLFQIEWSVDHGNVAALLGTARCLCLERILHSTKESHVFPRACSHRRTTDRARIEARHRAAVAD